MVSGLMTYSLTIHANNSRHDTVGISKKIHFIITIAKRDQTGPRFSNLKSPQPPRGLVRKSISCAKNENTFVTVSLMRKNPFLCEYVIKMTVGYRNGRK